MWFQKTSPNCQYLTLFSPNCQNPDSTIWQFQEKLKKIDKLHATHSIYSTCFPVFFSFGRLFSEDIGFKCKCKGAECVILRVIRVCVGPETEKFLWSSGAVGKNYHLDFWLSEAIKFRPRREKRRKKLWLTGFWQILKLPCLWLCSFENFSGPRKRARIKAKFSCPPLLLFPTCIVLWINIWLFFGAQN